MVGFQRWIFPQIHISVLLMAKFPVGRLSERGAHFSLFRVVEALAEKVFLVAGWRLVVVGNSAGSGVVSTERREAFCIISNYRHRGICAQWSPSTGSGQAGRNGEQRLAAGVRIILIM